MRPTTTPAATAAPHDSSRRNAYQRRLGACEAALLALLADATAAAAVGDPGGELAIAAAFLPPPQPDAGWVPYAWLTARAAARVLADSGVGLHASQRLQLIKDAVESLERQGEVELSCTPYRSRRARGVVQCRRVQWVRLGSCQLSP